MDRETQWISYLSPLCVYIMHTVQYLTVCQKRLKCAEICQTFCAACNICDMIYFLSYLQRRHKKENAIFMQNGYIVAIVDLIFDHFGSTL